MASSSTTDGPSLMLTMKDLEPTIQPILNHINNEMHDLNLESCDKDNALSMWWMEVLEEALETLDLKRGKDVWVDFSQYYSSPPTKVDVLNANKAKVQVRFGKSFTYAQMQAEAGRAGRQALLLRPEINGHIDFASEPLWRDLSCFDPGLDIPQTEETANDLVKEGQTIVAIPKMKTTDNNRNDIPSEGSGTSNGSNGSNGQ